MFLFSTIIANNICSDKDYVNLARSLNKNNRTTEAIKFYKKALKINPENFTAHWDLAIHFFKQRDYQQSLHYFSNLTKFGSENPYIFFNIAYNHNKLGQLDQALEFFHKFLEAWIQIASATKIFSNSSN